MVSTILRKGDFNVELRDQTSTQVEIWHTIGTQSKTGSSWAARNLLILLEAAIGIEPMNKGFAELVGQWS